MKFGDFSGLAKAYSESRPKYAPQILELLVKLGDLNSESTIIDVGAGTGIWTRMLQERLNASIIAIEPNLDMYQAGIKDSREKQIQWINSSAEDFELNEIKANMLTMASSFHWTEYDTAIKKFKSTLVPNGIFCALWNTRAFELNVKLTQIEEFLKTKLTQPRVSSGRSLFTDSLMGKLENSFGIENVLYTEAHHIEYMTRDRYIRIWESVNDIQVQLGEINFQNFIEFIKTVFSEDEKIEAHYLTRAWIARN